jgi:hypothetical protein
MYVPISIDLYLSLSPLSQICLHHHRLSHCHRSVSTTTDCLTVTDLSPPSQTVSLSQICLHHHGLSHCHRSVSTITIRSHPICLRSQLCFSQSQLYIWKNSLPSQLCFCCYTFVSAVMTLSPHQGQYQLITCLPRHGSVSPDVAFFVQSDYVAHIYFLLYYDS